MRLLTNFPKLCFIMVLLSIVGLCVAQENLQLLLVVGALAAISWYVTEGPRGRSLPRWVSNVLVIAITLHVLVDLLQAGSDILESLSRFALLLTLIKLYERRTPRDHSQLMSLSFLLMLIASLQTFELLFGLILLVYAVLGLYVLVLYQLYAAHDQMRRNRYAAIPEGVRLVPSTKPIIGRSPAMQFRALISVLCVGGFVLSIFAFIAFPRGIGETAFGDLSRSMARAVTGFADEVDLLHGRRINESRREVMHIQLLDEDGNPRRSPAGVMLMKGAVMDHYDGQGRWKRTDRQWHLRHMIDEEFRPVAPRRITDLPEWTMHVEALADSKVLFTTGRVIALRTGRPYPLQFDPLSGEIRIQPDGQPIRSYQVKFDFGDRHFARPSQVDSSEIAWRSSLRALRNERVAELAREILTNAGLPTEAPRAEETEGDRVAAIAPEVWEWRREAADAFERYLRSLDNFTYSIDLSHIVHSPIDGEYEDPIVRFLLHHRRGHCEYFASALMSLCYNVGIESRMITGFVAAAFDQATQRYKVLELNAHAWVEVRTGEHQWQTFDPTPPQVLNELHVPETTRADQLRWLYDRFDMAWNRTVVRYDSQTQESLAERWEFGIGERALRIIEQMKAWVNDLNRMFRFKPATYLWLGLIGLIIVLATMVVIQLFKRLLMLRHVLRLRHVRGREYRRMLRQLGFYLDMLTVLDRAKVGKPLWQPPLQFAEELAEHHPAEAEIVRQVATGFYRARYGQEPLSTEELQQMRSDVRALAEHFGVRL